MTKLQEMFSQARKAQNGGGMGFLGKNKAESKARAAALVIELPTITSGSAEAALKAGADGLLFTWDGHATTQFEVLKKELETAKATNENTASGLAITGNWDKLDQAKLKELKELGVQYLVLPFNAPARLLALEPKELEKVITVPMRKDEIYPLYISNLTAFDNIAAVLLDFNLSDKISSMSIEEVLDYRAVREAVRYPALLHIQSTLNEADAYTLMTLGVQAFVLQAKDVADNTREQIKTIRTLLEKIHQDTKDTKDKESTTVTSMGTK